MTPTLDHITIGRCAGAHAIRRTARRFLVQALLASGRGRMKWAWHKLAQFQAKSPVWVRLAGRFGLGVALMIAVCAGLAACTGGPHPEPPLPSFGASPDGGAHHETGSGGASPSGSAGSGGAGISAGSGGASAS